MGKLFGTDGIRGKANLYPITAEIALLVGRAIAYQMTQTSGKKIKRPKVLIGKDTRVSCYMLENAIAAGLCSGGADVLLTGPLPTPAISYITQQMRAAAGIVISASHNHYSDNGIKIFSSNGLKLSDEEELILEELILTEKIKDFRATDENIGRIKRIDHAYGRYVTFLKQNFPQDLDLTGMKVVLDCANGASYQVAPTVLEELGADVAVAKAGALVHDIGKALDHEVQGTHIEIGMRILQKFGADEKIITAMKSHHEDYPYETVESIIVQTADAISGGRPGARRDSVENYLKRLQELEALVNAFPSVEKSYALQAGREIRIFVTPEKISDAEAKLMARDIAIKIEQELKYPGEIKVTLIRETRITEYAR